ncbi:MAG: cytochrome c biogenesis protein CcsA [Actinomycetota bacterium]
MVWKICLTHAMLGVLGYVCFGIAALSGGIYLALQRLGDRGRMQQNGLTLEKIRSVLTCIYLTFGFLLLTGAIISGSFKARAFWGSNWFLDAKAMGSLVLWIYYLITSLTAILSALKENKRGILLSSALCVIGIVPLSLNFLINYTIHSQHHYL